MSKGKAQSSRSWRKWLFWGVVLLFLWVVWSRFAELDKLIETISQGRPLWIAAAFALQFIYYLIFTAVNWSSFDTVDVRFKFRELIPLTFASLFVNATVTSAGAAGTMLFVNDAQERGESAAGATAGAMLALTSLYSSFALVLTIGLVQLARDDKLTRLEGFTAAIMYGFVFLMVGILGLGRVAPEWLQRQFERVQRGVNWFCEKCGWSAWLADDWAQRNSADFTLASEAITTQPLRLVRTLLLALTAHIAAIISLYTIFRAFNTPVTVGILISLYAMTILFMIISPSPSGIGIVETLLPAIYRSVGISLEAGTIINLTFRGLSFWLPLLIGFILMRRLRLFKEDES